MHNDHRNNDSFEKVNQVILFESAFLIKVFLGDLLQNLSEISETVAKEPVTLIQLFFIFYFVFV
jgi:hypothetical protein